jgi:hypothetical protein
LRAAAGCTPTLNRLAATFLPPNGGGDDEKKLVGFVDRVTSKLSRFYNSLAVSTLRTRRWAYKLA